MKIHCIGSRFHAGQVSRIEDGFRVLGHEVTECLSDAALVFVNNPWFDQTVADKLAGRLAPGAKLVLGVQDIPYHIPDYDTRRLAEQLAHADAVTAISETTACDLLAATGIRAAGVTYQPIMPITRTGRRLHPYRALFIGRVCDKNKRATLAAEALSLLDLQGADVVTVGMEPPPFGGTYWGVASPETLNDLYNSVDFVVCTARFGGIELGVIEAMAAGAIPLILRDLHTREELLPTALFPEYAAVDPTPQGLVRFIAGLMDDGGARLADLRDRLHQHYLTQWAERTSPTGVAQRILNVYNTLT